LSSASAQTTFGMMTGFQFLSLSLVFGPLPVKLIGIQKTLPREIKPTEYEKILYNDDASQFGPSERKS
jgi:hypothetical protein